MDRTYDPIQVLKPVADHIWIADGPVVKFMGVKFPTRMTVIQRPSGNLVIHSPIHASETLLAQINALGSVEAMLAPNWIHYVSMQPWSEYYPNAKRWYAPGVKERASKEHIPLPDGLPIAGKNPWSPDIETFLVQGSTTHIEAVLFHPASRTLVLTDIIENFEADKVNPFFVPVAKMAGILAPDGSMPRDMRASFTKHKELLRQEIEKMIAWNPERVIIAHGKWFEKDGTAELQRAYEWVLQS